MGILLMADFPNFGEGGDTPLARRRYVDCMQAAVRRDFNHPSIIAWCLFNETWGFGGQADFIKLINPGLPESDNPVALGREPGGKLANQAAYDWIHEIWSLAKELDPTRLIEDMSVVAWEHLESYGHSATDINSWHFYTDNYEHARRHVEEVVRETYSGSSFNYVPGFAQEGQPLINSEYGGVGALDGDRDISWTFKFLTNELRRHGSISAYIFTELHDVEWERNGFLNYDRTPKEFGYDPRVVNQGDVLPIDAPPAAFFPPGAEVEIPVYSSHFSRTHHENVTLHWKLAGVDSFGRLHPNLASSQLAITFPWHQVDLVERFKLQLPLEPMLCTFSVRAICQRGQVRAHNFVHLVVRGDYRERTDEAGRIVLRLSVSNWDFAEWTKGHPSREDAETDGLCLGQGSGYFRWSLPINRADLEHVRRIQLVCEASHSRPGIAQTDYAAGTPSLVQVLLNRVRIGGCTLPNHPHDSRGVLSYLRSQPGNHGYLVHLTVEGKLLEQVMDAMDDGAARLSLEFRVPDQPDLPGGLCIYGPESGRYPLGPTLTVELRHQ